MTRIDNDDSVMFVTFWLFLLFLKDHWLYSLLCLIKIIILILLNNMQCLQEYKQSWYNCDYYTIACNINNIDRRGGVAGAIAPVLHHVK